MLTLVFITRLTRSHAGAWERDKRRQDSEVIIYRYLRQWSGRLSRQPW